MNYTQGVPLSSLSLPRPEVFPEAPPGFVCPPVLGYNTAPGSRAHFAPASNPLIRASRRFEAMMAVAGAGKHRQPESL